MNRKLFWSVYKFSALGAPGGYSPREFCKKLAGTYNIQHISDAEEMNGVPDPVTLNPSDLKVVREAIQYVWNQIAYDMETNANALVKSYGDSYKLTNIMCVESCIDADGLKTFAGNEGARASRIIDALSEKFGYDDVLEYLAKQIRLR